jgi:hypothetical protein
VTERDHLSNPSFIYKSGFCFIEISPRYEVSPFNEELVKHEIFREIERASGVS